MMMLSHDEIDVRGCSCVSNAKVYGLKNSIRRAKFPMNAELDGITNQLTAGIEKIAQSPRGSGHDQWLTGVIVQFDLTFSNKAWVEAERYHFLDFVSSQSTMHRITKFDSNTCYNEYVDPVIVEVMKKKKEAYNNETDPKKRQRMYLEILYSNPAGFMLTAGMTTNYRQLKTIYHQRVNHRLPEWREFCKWIATLPYGYLITCDHGEV